MSPDSGSPESALGKKLFDDLKQAIREENKLRRLVIRSLMAAIKNTEIAQMSPLDDPGILGVISKEVKKHQESIEAFKQGNRQDLVANEEAEMAVLNEYLPKQMTRDEIVAEARRIIAEVGAQGPGDKGKVMPKLVGQLKGRADGRVINEVVTGLLK